MRRYSKAGAALVGGLTIVLAQYGIDLDPKVLNALTVLLNFALVYAVPNR